MRRNSYRICALPDYRCCILNSAYSPTLFAMVFTGKIEVAPKPSVSRSSVREHCIRLIVPSASLSILRGLPRRATANITQSGE